MGRSGPIVRRALWAAAVVLGIASIGIQLREGGYDEKEDRVVVGPVVVVDRLGADHGGYGGAGATGESEAVRGRAAADAGGVGLSAHVPASADGERDWLAGVWVSDLSPMYAPEARGSGDMGVQHGRDVAGVPRLQGADPAGVWAADRSPMYVPARADSADGAGDVPTATPAPVPAGGGIDEFYIRALICSFDWPCSEALAVVYGPTPLCPNGESGGDPSAVNGQHAGLFQISLNWHLDKFGGAGLAGIIAYLVIRYLLKNKDKQDDQIQKMHEERLEAQARQHREYIELLRDKLPKN